MTDHNDLKNVSETYYGTWENLLALIDQKMDYYIHIAPIFDLLNNGGLRPGHMLNWTHPAYFSDAIARECLRTYDPQENMDAALERCSAALWHRQFTCMENADLSKARVDECTWDQYSLDALLRLAWRHLGENLKLPFYLKKESLTELSDPFMMEVVDGGVLLTQCTHSRRYEVDTAKLDFDAFVQEMHRFFKLATEDYGYFVPEFVWLSYKKIRQLAANGG